MVVTRRARLPGDGFGPAAWAAPGRIDRELSCRASGYCWAGELTCV